MAGRLVVRFAAEKTVGRNDRRQSSLEARRQRVVYSGSDRPGVLGAIDNRRRSQAPALALTDIHRRRLQGRRLVQAAGRIADRRRAVVERAEVAAPAERREATRPRGRASDVVVDGAGDLPSGGVRVGAP